MEIIRRSAPVCMVSTIDICHDMHVLICWAELSVGHIDFETSLNSSCQNSLSYLISEVHPPSGKGSRALSL
jgi:hypothetical protein